MIHDAQECFFNNKEEEAFLFSLLNEDMTVLEWGSGRSTLAIASRVRCLISIEHDRNWFDQMKDLIPSNVNYRFVNRNRVEKRGHDGSFDDYEYYIKEPGKLDTKFDLILVDGRARVECAKEALSLLKPEGSILIHDIFNPDHKCDRPEYWEVLQFLHPVAGQYALWQFKPKRNL